MTAFDHAQALYDAAEPDEEDEMVKCEQCFDSGTIYVKISPELPDGVLSSFERKPCECTAEDYFPDSAQETLERGPR